MDSLTLIFRFGTQARIFSRLRSLKTLYYETIELVYESNDVKDLPPFVFGIYDKDFNPLDSDDFICRALIPIKEAAHVIEQDVVPRP
jgi:hypothetical protein